MEFTILLGCFTAATSLSEEFIYIRKQLLIASIILGFHHSTIEFRHFIYDPIKWIFVPRNYFSKNYLLICLLQMSSNILICYFFLDLGAYLIPTYTSIYWLYIDDKPFFMLSISCLLLDFKFLLFFKVFESFGIYFIIIINVAKRIAPFLVILFIILVNFAHAFLILLKPREIYSLNEPPPINNNDPNNPWKLTHSYNQILENGAIASNPSFIQIPNANTNMFTDYKTSLFSMYLYLTGIFIFLFKF